ncbi:MAG: ATP-dependent helicase, partial [Chloroflexi bacterium]|nr:ATP-dependent helicase [Chloroflexota bacterium]
MLATDPTTLLDDLDPAQREAVETTRGPLVILAGAGTGKTRVIARRVAYALATAVVRPRDVLVVTFTDKAAGEMRTRLAALGQPAATASTFHAAALRQLRHFWPIVHGRAVPTVMASKAPLLAPLAASLPGGYRYLALRDLAAEIEWAKARRITPAAYMVSVAGGGHDGPLPPDLMAGLYRRYETAKDRAGVIDFEDMLERTVELLATDPKVAAEVHDRYRWFSVDEYQDTNPLQQALLEAWLGGRDDLAVVGDEDQTIYTFTGATSDYLTGFGRRYPGARTVRLESNFRSTPEVLGLANRVLAAGRAAPDERRPGEAARTPKQLIPTVPSGPAPSVGGFESGEDELGAVVSAIGDRLREDLAPGEIAVLVRTNAQLPALEDGLAQAGIPFHVRGERFFSRPEVRRALRVAAALDRPALRRVAEDPPDDGPLPTRLSAAFERELGVRADVVPDSEAGRERHGAIVTLLGLATALAGAD